MYKAIKIQQRNKPKDEIMVDSDEGLTASSGEATKIVTEFFKKTFNAEHQRKFEAVPPKQMSTPFTKEEVNKAIRSLKNNKSAGVDDIVAEQLKYGPEEINEGIAKLLNDISRTGNHPNELQEGILIPSQSLERRKDHPETSDP